MEPAVYYDFHNSLPLVAFLTYQNKIFDSHIALSPVIIPVTLHSGQGKNKHG
jgi:hypothetical protein